jgi:DNA polymerase elongation subunit (family B)
VQLIQNDTQDFSLTAQRMKSTIASWVSALIQARPNDVNDYVITTKLKDPLHSYSWNNHHHHIQAAFVLKGMGKEPVPQQRIRHIVVFEPLAHDQCASYPVEFLQASSNTEWKINYEYYARKHFMSEIKRLSTHILSLGEIESLLAPLLH